MDKQKLSEIFTKIKEYFDSCKGVVQLITGFIASDLGGLTTTLGRGGSDYTASIFSGALLFQNNSIISCVIRRSIKEEIL